MNDPTRIALKILAATLLVGILGDALLRATPWGANFTVWATALAAVILSLSPVRHESLASGGSWLLVPAALFPLGFVWRDSLILNALDFSALLIALSLILLRAQGRKVRYAGIVEYGLGSFVAGINALFSPFILLFHDIDWPALRKHGGAKPALAVGRGFLLSLPPVLIFGGLFVSADPVFKSIIENTFNLRFSEIAVHLFVIGFITWLACGYLRGVLLGKEIPSVLSRKRPCPKLGTTEASIVLGLIDALFLGFVIVQFRYFFGGPSLVQKTVGLSYAEYARRGFFELVAVAALVLPLLLFVHWLTAKGDASSALAFQLLAGTQVLLLFVIMASALQRMRLYQQEYGLTELRLYTTAFMGWLAVVFVWFGLTVLRGNRKPFAFGALVAGYVLIIALHALNPDALIARTNIARALQGKKWLDGDYVAQLSADSVPPLVEALPHLNARSMRPDDRCKLAAHLLRAWAPPQNLDWRNWSLARNQANRAVAANAGMLEAAACFDKIKD